MAASVGLSPSPLWALAGAASRHPASIKLHADIDLRSD
jgi:hypothetical protein